ncbi:hypothetical protein L6258_03700 [Candidatus Parcubacteria bacterium]|nr:hypothetical protein [Candidatus Parcubacteria bacterium]
MTAIVEPNKPKELSYNPGEIVVISGVAQWLTKAEGHELRLDIVPVPSPESTVGIASFVVMEQEQTFLNDVSKLLATAIVSRVTGQGKIVFLTAESKGSHLVPRVWDHLDETIGHRLEKRIVTLRKGQPKVYMQRPAMIRGQEISLSPTVFCSITSSHEQSLMISPKDAEFLSEVIERGARPVFVDDFIGTGGTIVAVCEIFEKLDLNPPSLVAVIGSDGNFYEDILAGLDITLLPQPFPLRLPTFVRNNPNEPWRI